MVRVKGMNGCSRWTLSLALVVATGLARAHGGEDHGAVEPVATGDELVSVESTTRRFELLVRWSSEWPAPGAPWSIEAFVSDARSNAPTPAASVTLRFEGPAASRVELKSVHPGRLRGEAPAPPAGRYGLTAVLTLEGGGEVFVIDGVVLGPEHASEERHAAASHGHDHDDEANSSEDGHPPWAFWGVLGGVLVMGLGGLFVASRRGKLALGLLVFAGHVEVGDVRAHGGEEHAHPQAPVASAGRAVWLPKDAQHLLEVRTARVARRQVTPRFTVTGMVTVPPDRDRTVSAPLTGELRTVSELGLGRQVKAGEVLFELVALPDAGDLATLLAERAREEARLSGLSARVKQANAALVRARSLADQGGALSRREVEEAEAALAEARAALSASKAAVTALSSGPGTALRVPIASPFDGQVVALHAAAGQVTAGQPLVRIVGTAERQVVAQVLETDIARVVVGPAEVRVDQPSGQARRILPAHHLFTSPVVDPLRRSVEVRFAVDDDAPLWINQFVTVALPTGPASRALTVPDSALVDLEGRPAVWVKRSAETFAPVGVRVTARDGGFTAVVGALTEGDLVVVSGAAFLAGARPARRP